MLTFFTLHLVQNQVVMFEYLNCKYTIPPPLSSLTLTGKGHGVSATKSTFLDPFISTCQLQMLTSVKRQFHYLNPIFPLIGRHENSGPF